MRGNERRAHRNFAGLTTTLGIRGLCTNNTNPDPAAEHGTSTKTAEAHTNMYIVPRGNQREGGADELLLCMRASPNAPIHTATTKALSSNAGRLAPMQPQYLFQISGRLVNTTTSPIQSLVVSRWQNWPQYVRGAVQHRTKKKTGTQKKKNVAPWMFV